MSVFFTLGDFYSQVISGQWSGSISETCPDIQTDIKEEIQKAELLCAGINFGDKVIVKTYNSVATVAVLITLWHKGAVVVPLKYSISTESMLVVAADCNAKFAVDPELRICETIGSYQVPKSTLCFSQNRRLTGVDLALIIYTSGSTGRPKGIMLSHANVISALGSIVTYLNLSPEDCILCVPPLSFDYGLYQVLFSFFVGLKVVLFRGAVQPAKVMKALVDSRATVFPVVPVLASQLIRLQKAFKTQFPSLKKVTNTGGHFPEAIIDAYLAQLPHVEIYAMYGLTECKRAMFLPPKDLQRKKGSVGIPMPGLDAAVLVSENGMKREALPNEVGELFVRGSSVMQGYYQSDGGGATLFPGVYRDDNWLATGDLFMRDDEGYFYFKGRLKELIKQGGFCLYPVEIESLVLKCPLVESVAVVGAYDSVGAEEAILFVKLTPPDGASIQSDFETWLGAHIDPDYRPRVVQFVSDMPLSANGKVDKTVLKERISKRAEVNLFS